MKAKKGTTEDELLLRTVRCCDGVYYSYTLLRYFHSTIYGSCCGIAANKDDLVVALASAWGFVDALHRLREICLATPGLNAKSPEMRAFLHETQLAETARHYIQHLRGELSKSKPYPVWGALSWVDPGKPMHFHVALLGAQIKGIGYSGPIFDLQEGKWLSRVSLAVGDQTFSFDRQFDAAIKAERHIADHFRDRITPLPNHRKVPIITNELVRHADGTIEIAPR